MSTTVQRGATASKTVREFIGRGWINEVKNGSHKGEKFINASLDRGKNGVEKITLVNTPSLRLQLWPNNKREGKKDADYRLSIVMDPSETAAK